VWYVCELAERRPAYGKGDSGTILGGESSLMKKTYEKPAIIHTEEIEARAVRCTKLTTLSCNGGPVTS